MSTAPALMTQTQDPFFRNLLRQPDPIDTYKLIENSTTLAKLIGSNMTHAELKPLESNERTIFAELLLKNETRSMGPSSHKGADALSTYVSECSGVVCNQVKRFSSYNVVFLVALYTITTFDNWKYGPDPLQQEALAYVGLLESHCLYSWIRSDQDDSQSKATRAVAPIILSFGLYFAYANKKASFGECVYSYAASRYLPYHIILYAAFRFPDIFPERHKALNSQIDKAREGLCKRWKNIRSSWVCLH